MHLIKFKFYASKDTIKDTVKKQLTECEKIFASISNKDLYLQYIKNYDNST